MILCFEKRESIDALMHGASNDFRLMAHAFKSIRLNKLPMARFAQKALFDADFSLSRAVFHDIF
jgi:hypothetical protein